MVPLNREVEVGIFRCQHALVITWTWLILSSSSNFYLAGIYCLITSYTRKNQLGPGLQDCFPDQGATWGNLVALITTSSQVIATQFIPSYSRMEQAGHVVFHTTWCQLSLRWQQWTILRIPYLLYPSWLCMFGPTARMEMALELETPRILLDWIEGSTLTLNAAFPSQKLNKMSWLS